MLHVGCTPHVGHAIIIFICICQTQVTIIFVITGPSADYSQSLLQFAEAKSGDVDIKQPQSSCEPPQVSRLHALRTIEFAG
ncbi:hypothetical protein BDV32DRAFT_148541 [Aspergillus pseudonomiae]|uniref:Uncharacterized protein n=1 Tax=Aspergillus pseudonomiae TaxID=1506151 RepID=A0A5N6I526_9EURO|nr:uncharacterized protein BDV37DRAFT_277652 [Aspergillus pseudonomiae]KAB8261274.1 hypothetical protein BDV32DRAFT_148541 [Aspergillus pseudonomiae]KAE8410008.1 hypothetical protein BDV37DRAFT_277652 [Aspergillus pseudonomiae]